MARVILQVRPKILAKAKTLIQNISSSPEKPVFAVHFRRTDKKLDLGITNSLSLTGVSFVHQALARFAQITKSNNINGTLLVLSDDPRAIDELRQDLGSSYTIQGLSDVQTFFREEKDYLRYLKEGHTYMEEQEMFDKDPQAVHGYYESVIVDAVAAGLGADYLIGMGCSGVSQLVAQWIGGRERTEGNALALWQEDLSSPAPQISRQGAVEQIHPEHLPLPSSSSSASVGATTRCAFCEGEKVIPNLDLVVPKTGGQTCRSIKKMADGEMNGSTICASLKKEERVCCTVVQEKASSLQSLRTYWNGYRLADGVKGYDRKISNKHDVCKRWPGSILCEYLKRTEQKKDISTLADIVRHWDISGWGDLDKPSANTTVMHLRLGDGLCGRYDQARLNCRTVNPGNRSCWDNDTDCFKSTNGLLYAYPKEYYEPVAQDLLKFLGNKTRIIVVADPSHWGRNKDMRNGDYSIDYAYRDNVVSFFRSKGFVTQVRQHSGRPDDDFIYMSSAQNFVRGGGAFSTYIAEVVTANGGRVFEPRILSK